MPSQQQTLEQKRAAQAWADVTGALNQAKAAAQAEESLRREAKDALKRLQNSKGAEDFRGKYGTLARKAPALITSMGLGQTLAFLRAKGKKDDWNEHSILYQHITNWVVTQIGKSGDLLDIVCQESSEVYRQATAETIALLVWIKRFAEAELPEAEGSD
jgi:CRISPR-associated protein Cmr5